MPKPPVKEVKEEKPAAGGLQPRPPAGPKVVPAAGGGGGGGGGAPPPTLRDAIEAGPGKREEAVSTLCCGDGGVEELAKMLPDPALPCFGMLRLTVGEGTFAREKTVMVSFQPEACSGIKRAKAAAKKNDVRRLLGDVHSEWVVGHAEELTVGAMLEAVKHIAADTASAAFSIAKMKADYEAMIASSKAAAAGGRGGGGGGKAPVDLKSATGRLTAAEMAVKVPSHAALKAVREPMGPFNWALFAPSEPGKELNFVNAGSLSVNECRKWLKEDENYFGILRMGFGSGMFRRTKWIFFTLSITCSKLSSSATVTCRSTLVCPSAALRCPSALAALLRFTTPTFGPEKAKKIHFVRRNMPLPKPMRRIPK